MSKNTEKATKILTHQLTHVNSSLLFFDAKFRLKENMPDCKVLFLRGEQKISSNFLRGSGTETSVSKPVQTDT